MSRETSARPFPFALDRIYALDCRVGLRRLPERSVDCIITDPPYGVGKASWDVGCLDLLDVSAGECARVLKDDGLLVWFLPTRFLLKIALLIQQYIPYRWCFVWVSPNKMSPGDLGFSKHTTALIFSRSKPFRNMPDVKVLNHSSRWKLDGGHPTPKPLELMQYLVEKMTVPGDLVLDPFMGSGTLAVACQQTGRHFLGFEVEQSYVDIANKRLRDAAQLLPEQSSLLDAFEQDLP